MVYLVVYDLNGDNSNENAIIGAIKGLGAANACLNRALLVDVDCDSGGVYDVIEPFLKAGDRLFVCPIGKDASAGRTFKVDNVWGWLHDHSV